MAILQRLLLVQTEMRAVAAVAEKSGTAVESSIPEFGARLKESLAERFDGKGYPDGIAGEAISLGARIFAVADVFDSLISGRPYRTAMDRKKAH